MSEALPENGREFRIGVLIIGSLWWDPTEHRKKWRDDRLDIVGARRVQAPIRYGRRSNKRGCSYTMVFSQELVDEEQLGQAIVVPCSRTVNDTGGIVEEAKELWLAERPRNSEPNNRISADWGCVALVKHPGVSDEVRMVWQDRVSRERCYGQLNSAVDEAPAVDPQSGILNISWPTPVDGRDLPCDVLLATATNPTIVGGHYPTPEQIADAWNTPDGKQHVNYFHENREHDIETFQDPDIEERLLELGQ